MNARWLIGFVLGLALTVAPAVKADSGLAEYEIWRYDRGSRSFPAILRFEDGVLKTLEFETG